MWNSDKIQKLTNYIKKEIMLAKIMKLSHFKGISRINQIEIQYFEWKRKFEAWKIVPNDKSKIQYFIKQYSYWVSSKIFQTIDIICIFISINSTIGPNSFKFYSFITIFTYFSLSKFFGWFFGHIMVRIFFITMVWKIY
jgi:hypothetical protein